MRFDGALVITALALLLPMDGFAGELFDFHSEPGRFKIGFPGDAPASRALSGDKFSATDNDAYHVVEVDEAKFSVELHDIPRVASMLLTDDFVLEQAAKGMLNDIGGRQLEARRASRQDQPARWISFEIPDREVRGDVLLVLADRRLYLVSSHHPVEQHPPVSFAKFLESFRFWLE